MTAVLAVATGVVVAALTWSASASTTPKTIPAANQTDDGFSNTQFGPLGPADRAMLVAVRQSGLWQSPLTQQARQMADGDQVRAIAASMANDQDGLASQVRSTANRLGVVLPSLPTTQQQAWLAELSGETGGDYDRTLVNRLRSAASTTLAQVDRVRDNTQNVQVRAVAVRATDVLNRQIQNLDSTGLVSPASAAPPDTGSHNSPLGAVALLALACVFGLVRTARPPRRHRNLILAPLTPRREF